MTSSASRKRSNQIQAQQQHGHASKARQRYRRAGPPKLSPTQSLKPPVPCLDTTTVPQYIGEPNNATIRDSTIPLTGAFVRVPARKLQDQKPATVKLCLPKSNHALVSKVKAAYERPPVNGSCPFLAMPGELRNRVYDLVFAPVMVAGKGYKFWVDDQTMRNIANKDLPMHKPVNSTWGCTKDFIRQEWEIVADRLTHAASSNHSTDTRPHIICYRNSNKQLVLTEKNRKCTFPSRRKVNVGLFFTCHQVYLEFGPFVYSSSTFGFGHLGQARRLLTGAKDSQEAKRAAISGRILARLSVRLPSLWALVKTLHLDVGAYGEPMYTKDRVWCASYYESWRKVVQGIVENLKGLNHLSLFITVPRIAPLRLCHADCWAYPFVEFAKSESLETANVALSVLWFPEIVEAFSEYMRRTILGWSHEQALEALAVGEDKYPKSVVDNVKLGEHWSALKRDNAEDPWIYE